MTRILTTTLSFRYGEAVQYTHHHLLGSYTTRVGRLQRLGQQEEQGWPKTAQREESEMWKEALRV